MHSEVLSKAQQRLLPLIKSFSSEYYLAGGTAVALYIANEGPLILIYLQTQT